jgi:hypothetical protein
MTLMKNHRLLELALNGLLVERTRINEEIANIQKQLGAKISTRRESLGGERSRRLGALVLRIDAASHKP